MKILIAVPTFENIDVECFKSIYDLDKGGHDVAFESVKGYDCAKARNIIAKRAIDGGYDYVMMLDSDTIIPKDALVNMLDPKTDIVMGCVPRKLDQSNSVLFASKDNAKGKGFRKSLLFSELDGTERINLKGGGFGCVLIDTKVIRTLAYPYFKYIVYEDGSALSEDLYFCRLAKDKRFKIEADPRVKCGHVAKRILYGEAK